MRLWSSYTLSFGNQLPVKDWMTACWGLGHNLTACFQMSAQLGFVWGHEEGGRMTKNVPATLKSRNICWSREPWSSLGAALATEQHLALPYLSSISGEKTIIQHWKQQARRAREEQMLRFFPLQAQLSVCPSWRDVRCKQAPAGR